MSLETNDSFTKFMSLVTIDEPNVQNVQEMSQVWGQIREEFAALDATLEDAYAVLGQVDFVVIFDAPSTDVAFQAGVTLERHGLEARTMHITPTDHFGELVGDL